ncbi:MAG: coenzyme F420-0:L-glutamate ligase [Candidatus Lokiarchaeota archaeon]|nr:coenzyme F420-0:L-glutamate ligase [Candidatus Lokiarchaeota archaeon]
MNEKIEILSLKGFPLVNPGDNISSQILTCVQKNKICLEDGDIVIIAQTIVSKSNGRIRNLKEIVPTTEARNIYRLMKQKTQAKNLPLKTPEHIQAILDESKELLKIEHVLITETRHGFVCANAGIDKSNVEGEGNIALLPENPDEDAKTIAQSLKKATNKEVAVIITDSFGRPFRVGAVGVALGIFGIRPEKDQRGYCDLFGHILESTIVGQADNLASAAQLVMGEANEGQPVVIIRGYNFSFEKNASIKTILRDKKADLFRIDKSPYDFEMVLKNRRSYKLKFNDEELDAQIIKECVKLATLAPSAHNGQFWRYFLLEKGDLRNNLIEKMNQELKNDLLRDGRTIEFITKKKNKTRRKFIDAPYLMLACLDTTDLEKYGDDKRRESEYILGVQSVSASIMCLLLALESKKLAACWYCAPLFAKEVVKKALNLPNSFEPLAFLTIGRGTKEPIIPNRKGLSEIMFSPKDFY